MANEDLSKLKIDPSARAFGSAKRKKWLYVVPFFLILVSLAVLYWNGVLSPAVPVEVATISQVHPSQMLSQLNASGYVVAQRKAAVASKVTGRLEAIMVEEGSHVKGGQVIALLENRDAIAAREQAEANLRLAHANLEGAQAELEETTLAFNRNKELYARRIIAKAQYEAAEARYLRAKASVTAAEAATRAAAAALEAAKVAVEYTMIKAPFDAVVLTKNADVGDIVTPLGAAANAKAAVVTIADLKSLQVEADVSETNLGLVKVGQSCEIQLDALPESRFRGVVHAIVPTADRTKATVMVKVRFLEKDPRILPEMRAKVSFLSRPIKAEEQRPRTAVNRSALLDHGSRATIFVLEGNRVMERVVTTGEELGDMIEIVEGAKVGERVILRPPKRLKSGTRIKIAEK